MVFAVFVLVTALTISAVAGYYSIVGLTAIFSGAVTTIAIMGTVLEVGKLVTASWLYNNWRRAPLLIRMYLTSAVIVLMFITSMGIFGYLSRAHLAQLGPSDDVRDQIEKIDFEVEQQHTRIERAKHVLERFDQALEKYYAMEYVTRALREREKQTPEREALQKQITEANASVEELTTRKFDLKKKLRGIEAEVGPIRYIAELVYGKRAEEFLDDSVRAVIIILIFVFDPLAVLLVIAGNMSIRFAREDRAARLAVQAAAVVQEPEPAVAEGPNGIDEQPDRAPPGSPEPASVAAPPAPEPAVLEQPERRIDVQPQPVDVDDSLFAELEMVPEPAAPIESGPAPADPAAEAVGEALENIFQDIFDGAGEAAGGRKQGS